MRLVFRRVFRGCPQSAVSRSQNNGWHRYWGTFCQRTLNIEETFFTWSVPVSVPVGVDHNIHEVRIIEGWSGPVERFVGVCPCRRPCLPEVSNDVPPVLFQTDAALLGVEVPLVPHPRGSPRGRRLCGVDGILDRIAPYGDKAFDQLRMQDRGDTGGPQAPIKP